MMRRIGADFIRVLLYRSRFPRSSCHSEKSRCNRDDVRIHFPVFNFLPLPFNYPPRDKISFTFSPVLNYTLFNYPVILESRFYRDEESQGGGGVTPRTFGQGIFRMGAKPPKNPPSLFPISSPLEACLP
jgi:hypothetical protein